MTLFLLVFEKNHSADNNYMNSCFVIIMLNMILLYMVRTQLRVYLTTKADSTYGILYCSFNILRLTSHTLQLNIRETLNPIVHFVWRAYIFWLLLFWGKYRKETATDELGSHTLLHPQLFDLTFPCEFRQLLAVILLPPAPLWLH